MPSATKTALSEAAWAPGGSSAASSRRRAGMRAGLLHSECMREQARLTYVRDKVGASKWDT
eukprot:1598355-Prymnesium_polylepis.1